MNSLITFVKKLRLRQVLTVFLAGLLLIVSTACSSKYAQGAQPYNPPVQAGGANNPYKNSGDEYTNLKMSKSGRDQASLQLNSQVFLAGVNDNSELLYPGAETPVGRAYKEGELPIKSEKDFRPNAGNLIQNEPSVNQRAKDRIETVKEAVEEASGFLKDKANEAGKRPELQRNPAVNK